MTTNQSNLLTNVELLEEIMQRIFDIFNEYHLQQGDVTTLLAHLTFYNLYKKGIH